MSKIRIKNFGPIKEGYIENGGWISIDKVTVFIGNQGSGKSTVAKLISTFSWIEKAIYRGDIDDTLSRQEVLDYMSFQRINNYVKPDTIIEYEGDMLKIVFTGQTTPHFEKQTENNHRVPQIVYIPAERNFLSSIKNPYAVKGLPETLRSFAIEYKNSQSKYAHRMIPLPIGNVKYQYIEGNEEKSLIYGQDYILNLTEAASGYQSFIPMYMVTGFLIEQIKNKVEKLDVNQEVRKAREKDKILNDASLTSDEKISKANEIDSKYINSYLLNIVEEPELNLFPASQWEMLKSLLEANNSIDKNKLIITTHSPYIVNYLSLAVQAASLKDVISDDGFLDRLNSIVPLTSTVNASDLVIYEMNEITGTITKLGNYEGIPSDQNYLNQSLVEGNRLFDALLEIEQEL